MDKTKTWRAYLGEENYTELPYGHLITYSTAQK